MDWHRHLLWLTVPLIGMGSLLLVVLNPDHGEHVIVGYLIGTVFAFSTLASAWTAFGPLSFVLLTRVNGYRLGGRRATHNFPAKG